MLAKWVCSAISQTKQGLLRKNTLFTTAIQYTIFTFVFGYPKSGYFNECWGGIWPCGMALFVLHIKIWFGNTFISWINLLHTSPLACVRSNNYYSHYFPLNRGTRQGCPLSPILFAIPIEPLAVALKSSKMLGISSGGFEHKLFLYANNLLLFFYYSSSVSFADGVWADFRL